MESSKSIFMSIIAAGILGTTAVAWAQPGMGGMGGRGDCNMGQMGMGGMAGRPGMMNSGMKFDPAARADMRLTRLKAEIKPTAQQEPLWNAFAEKARAEAGKGMAAMREQAQAENLTAPARMDRMNAMMKDRLAAREAVTDSFKRLYDALSPEQQKAADLHMSRIGRMGGRTGPGGAAPRGPGPQGMGGEGERHHG